jgi:hypothetical protein
MKTMRASVIALACLALVAFASAEDEPSATNGVWTTERVHHEVAVKRGHPIRIENPYGDIRVRTMKDERIAVFGFLQTRGAAAGTPRLECHDADPVTVSVVPASSIVEPLPEGAAFRADLSVFVPRGNALEIVGGDGLVYVRGMRCRCAVQTRDGDVMISSRAPVSVYSGGGSVDLLFLDCAGGGSTVVTEGGDVTLRLPKVVNARVSGTTSGHLVTEVSVQVDRPVASARKHFDARICEGEHGSIGRLGRFWRRVLHPLRGPARVHVQSGSGDVRLIKATPDWRGGAREEGL